MEAALDHCMSLIPWTNVHVKSFSSFIVWPKMSSLVSIFSAVLAQRVQAAHLQGQDDSDHQVWNQSYKSKYVVL